MLLLDKSLAAAVSILSRAASATTGHSGLPHDGDASGVGEKPLFQVEAGSVNKAGQEVRFTVTDTHQSVQVVYRGLLPDLFREGQGVVAEGALGADGVFVAREVLAKHDENYMPPEVAKALKESGRWQEGEGTVR